MTLVRPLVTGCWIGWFLDKWLSKTFQVLNQGAQLKVHGYEWPRPLCLWFSLFCSSNSDLPENLLQSVYLHMKCNTRRIREGLCYLYVDEFERILGKIQSWNKYREYCDNPRTMKHLRRVSSGLFIYIASECIFTTTISLFNTLVKSFMLGNFKKSYQND